MFAEWLWILWALDLWAKNDDCDARVWNNCDRFGRYRKWYLTFSGENLKIIPVDLPCRPDEYSNDNCDLRENAKRLLVGETPFRDICFIVSHHIWCVIRCCENKTLFPKSHRDAIQFPFQPQNVFREFGLFIAVWSTRIWKQIELQFENNYIRFRFMQLNRRPNEWVIHSSVASDRLRDGKRSYEGV